MQIEKAFASRMAASILNKTFHLARLRATSWGFGLRRFLWVAIIRNVGREDRAVLKFLIFLPDMGRFLATLDK